jgi:hypothetical protein
MVRDWRHSWLSRVHQLLTGWLRNRLMSSAKSHHRHRPLLPVACEAMRIDPGPSCLRVHGVAEVAEQVPQWSVWLESPSRGQGCVWTNKNNESVACRMCCADLEWRSNLAIQFECPDSDARNRIDHDASANSLEHDVTRTQHDCCARAHSRGAHGSNVVRMGSL